MSFDTLGLSEALLRTIGEKQFSHPTPIQAEAIPPAVAGRDVFGCAQTGTGKTAAFALPVLHRLKPAQTKKKRQPIRSLVLAPTRELAAQIGETFGELGKGTGIKHTVIFGGVNQRPQCAALRRGVDVLIATPGRLLDLISQGEVALDKVEVLILDEADRMLDMGFIHDIKRVVALVPKKRQTMFFSATMPPEIDQFSKTLLKKPERIVIAPEAPAAETVDQAVHYVPRGEKLDLLRDLLTGEYVEKAIVFTRTKHGADKVARKLSQADIPAAAMHSGKTQNQRLRTLKGFRSGRINVLVASDIAARGIDVSDISHVFNFDMPVEAETYVHRIGRTGRAGLSGKAVSFCSPEEQPLLRDIERLLTREIPIASGEPDHEAEKAAKKKPNSRGRNGGRRSGPRNGKPRAQASGSTGGGSKPRRRTGKRSAGGGNASANSGGKRGGRRGPRQRSSA